MLQHFLNGNILTIKQTIMSFSKDYVTFARRDISKWIVKSHRINNENDPVLDSLYDYPMNHSDIKWCLDNHLPKVMAPEQIASLKLPDWYKDDQPWDTKG